MNEIKEEYLNLVSELKKWCKGNENIIKKAYFGKDYLSLEEKPLLFLVETKSSTYNDDFEDSLTNLNLKIANNHKYKNISISVQSWPNIGENIGDYFMLDEMDVIF